MSATLTSIPTFQNVGQLLRYLGNIPAERIRLVPAPGHATEEDLLRLVPQGHINCELVFGTLVEKATGTPQSNFTLKLYFLLQLFSKSAGSLVVFYGEHSLIRFSECTIREPDLSFHKWDRLPGGQAPDDTYLRHYSQLGY